MYVAPLNLCHFEKSRLFTGESDINLCFDLYDVSQPRLRRFDL